MDCLHSSSLRCTESPALLICAAELLSCSVKPESCCMFVFFAQLLCLANMACMPETLASGLQSFLLTHSSSHLYRCLRPRLSQSKQLMSAEVMKRKDRLSQLA